MNSYLIEKRWIYFIGLYTTCRLFDGCTALSSRFLMNTVNPRLSVPRLSGTLSNRHFCPCTKTCAICFNRHPRLTSTLTNRLHFSNVKKEIISQKKTFWPGREQKTKAWQLFGALQHQPDELCLNHLAQPARTLSTEQPEGSKTSKARIIVSLCVASDGSDKRKPLVVGSAMKLRCFRGFDPDLHVTWTANKRAWMTSVIYQA